jgi:predicted transcriptional regulator
MSTVLLEDVIHALDCQVLTGQSGTRDRVWMVRPVIGAYACDMLSWVMSHLAAGQVWLTILNSINVIAVAALTDCTCVLLTENVSMPEEILRRADEKSVIVLSTGKPTFEASAVLDQLFRQADGADGAVRSGSANDGGSGRP